ncbi:V-type ATP synthase subunit A [methanotrophic endosymbiont of Bathymodiolus puteoserpentis (Logatchev)]|jgi:V/A-type H+-transporting ATPase subunit A|uniref:V-type ATP synthase subunit A n=1 Tax=methanotrophic endosymbiont of Bathymodiolus puteoserpentis (Logatchev) TaxID=343235 RepID=UPI0013CC49E5|nr:V-type ATP synthase subunit A [methanotrophic endosymbiont of Bathymodiolus puteoserpentis (Logatchev)]SHE21947.1 V-type ATP synthase subunit A [methanotrophic endosymbiont of Bathymodiolus puteoserpentis (Logatchev)]
MKNITNASARVVSVQDSLVSIETLPESKQPLTKNEVVYILPTNSEVKHQERLKAEILRINGSVADAQVYESTAGVAIGDLVEQSAEMLSVELGPGLLGQVYDGLQNPLDKLADEFGYFLPRGVEFSALDNKTKWAFTPIVQVGTVLRASSVIGTVPERGYTHKIMVPFDIQEEVTVTWIQEGSVTVDEPVASIKLASGEERKLTLKQRWPVRKALPKMLLKQNIAKRIYPHEPLVTHLRLIDSFFPIAKGGMGCIPGPFGAGKTVLQNLISRNSDVDIVIVVACGERAGEVVETITEFPKLKDAKGDTLMDRTIIICNTSSMPVAAREASIYTGITLGEYYRQMGLNVLLIADSTSRWAQAMRETSGRLEEIPGEEAFPAYLDSSIKGIYERAGVIRTADQREGTLTMIGTVSPAGGNFEEPVTQATLGTVKTFLGLSAARAYKRFYPAVDPLLSWSRYLEQLQPWFTENLSQSWVDNVQQLLKLLRKGDEISQMIQVTGEEGVTNEDYITFQQALFLDMVYLQQDAFDPVDLAVPLERQQESLNMIVKLVNTDYYFTDKDATRDYFTKLTGLFKNLNYSPRKSNEYNEYSEKIEALRKSVMQDKT